MTTPPTHSAAGWPDDTRPGYPLNPDVDGWHWIILWHRRIAAQWNSQNNMWRQQQIILKNDNCLTLVSFGAAAQYLGPCLTPAQHTAAVEAARLEENARLREALGAFLEVGDCPPGFDFGRWFEDRLTQARAALTPPGAKP